MRRGLNIFLLVLKILIPVALVAYLVICGIDLVDAYLEDLAHVGQDGVYIQQFGLSYAILLIFGFIYNGAALVLALVGLFTSIGYRSAYNRKGNIVTFLILTFAPVVAELLFVLMYSLIPSIVG